jgi:hypothetical protein
VLCTQKGIYILYPLWETALITCRGCERPQNPFLLVPTGIRAVTDRIESNRAQYDNEYMQSGVDVADLPAIANVQGTITFAFCRIYDSED